jgi:hypothetical protein
LAFGGYHWSASLATGLPTPVGTIMVATVAAISGLQFLLAFIGHDIASVPRSAIHPLMQERTALLPPVA